MHYGTDLAWIHSVGFSDFVRAAAPHVLRTLGEHGIASGLVVDLGCGAGVLAKSLVGAGFDVLGVDISPGMIELARGRVPAGEFRCASFLDVELPSCVAVTSLGEPFNYLAGAKAGEGGLESLFRRIHAALEPGGVLLFDLSEPGRGLPDGAQAHRLGEDWACFASAREDPSRRELTRRITTFRRIDYNTWRRADETHRLRLYDRDWTQRTISKAGFDATVRDSYGPDVPAWPGMGVHVARERREARDDR